MLNIYFVIFALTISLSHFHAKACDSDLFLTSELYEQSTVGTGVKIDFHLSERLFSIGNPEKFKYLTQYNDYVNSQVIKREDLNQYALLKRQRALFERYGVGSLELFDLLIKKEVGNISKMSCLQSFLLNKHLSLTTALNKYSEFYSIILKSASTVRVYFYSTNTPSGALPQSMQIDFERDVRSDVYKYFTHIHNHPFNFKNPYGDIGGTVIPSSTDLKTYMKHVELYQMNSAQIINGLDALELNRLEIKLLN